MRRKMSIEAMREGMRGDAEKAQAALEEQQAAHAAERQAEIDAAPLSELRDACAIARRAQGLPELDGAELDAAAEAMRTPPATT